MSTVIAAATALTMSDLLTAVRRAVGDIETSTGNQRFTNEEIFAAIDFSLAEMWTRLQTKNAAGRLQSHTLTYDASSESEPLPDGIEANSIYKVEDYTDSTQPLMYDYVAVEDLNRPRNRPAWTLQNGSIYLWPRPTDGKTLRIWTAAYFPRTADADLTDTHALPVNHEELIVLGAAIRLQEIDDEAPPARIERKAELMKLFVESSGRIKARTYVSNVRSYK